MTLTSVVARLRSGDHRAFDELAREHRADLEAVARRMIRCSEIAADIVQDVLYRLWRDRDRLVIEGPLRPYLRRAVRNRALDQVKRHRVETQWRARELVEQADAVSPARDDLPGWDQALVRALGELPAKRRRRCCSDGATT